MTAKGMESIEKRMIKFYNVSICVVERKEKAYKSRPIPLVGANFVFTKEEGKKEKNAPLDASSTPLQIANLGLYCRNF